jgi:autotransporter-associated beta strand protein
MKLRFNPFVVASLVTFSAFTHTASAVDVIKDNNTNALNLSSSWLDDGGLGDITPATPPGHVAVWNNTVAAANTTDLGGNLSWAGIRIASPGGVVTVRHAAGQTLTLGASGIDMSAASQNLVLMSAATANTAGTLAIGANQTWNIRSGSTLGLFSTSNSANQRLSGSGNIGVTGGGLVNLNVGDQGSTTMTAGNGNDTYTGNWTISGGSKVISLRNGTHAWGQGSITLDNGTMSQNSGNWSFSNNITIASGGGTIYSDSSGNARYLNLTGVISGGGALNFNAIAAMTTQEGFILTGANSFTGPMTINPNATVRIGGDATTSMNSTAAGTLGSIASSVAITNNGILGFGRTDAHTFANTITGSGLVRLGRAGGVLPASQVVTLSGTNSYTGATQVNAGRLNLTGTLTSAITVASGAKISGTGSTTGLLTLSSGGGLVLAGGATTSSLTVNGATFAGSNLVTFLTDPGAGTVYDVFTYGAGAVTTPENLSVAFRGTLSNDVPNQKYIFTAGASGTRTWNTSSGTWAQASGTSFAEGDQMFYGGDSVVFNDTGAASTVTLSGRLAPASVSVNNSTNTYTFSGTDGTSDITGASTLSKSGGGTLLITSAHTFTGTTAVNGGVLEVGNGGTTGALGSGALSVAAGAELVFNRSNAFTVSNGISGDGLVTKKGAGRMTVNGNNSGGTVNWNFTGTGSGDIGFQNAAAVGGTGSTINLAASATGSVFFATNGNTSDVGISLGTDSVLTWNGSTGNTTTLSGLISGAGSLNKISGETVALTAANTYTGSTTVTTGTLVINGSVSTGLVAVKTGATLKGLGTIGGATTIEAGGTLSPGLSPGLLTINDTLTLAGSTLMEIGGQTLGTGYDSVAVSGLLTYGGALNIISVNAYDLAQNASYTLFGLAAGETGTFSSVSVGGLPLLGNSGIWTADNGGLTYTFTESTGQLAVIPEPRAALLGGLGLLILLRRRRSTWATQL